MSNGYSFVLGIQLKKHIQMKLVRCPEWHNLHAHGNHSEC